MLSQKDDETESNAIVKECRVFIIINVINIFIFIYSAMAGESEGLTLFAVIAIALRVFFLHIVRSRLKDFED